MHCNLRPPDVAQAILGFNYKNYNAPAYKFNNFVTSADPKCINLPNFSEIPQGTIHC